MPLSQFYDLLCRHDWSYQYASGSAYYAGQRTMGEIEFAARHSPEHEKLRAAYSAFMAGKGERPERPADPVHVNLHA